MNDRRLDSNSESEDDNCRYSELRTDTEFYRKYLNNDFDSSDDWPPCPFLESQLNQSRLPNESVLISASTDKVQQVANNDAKGVANGVDSEKLDRFKSMVHIIKNNYAEKCVKTDAASSVGKVENGVDRIATNANDSNVSMNESREEETKLKVNGVNEPIVGNGVNGGNIGIGVNGVNPTSNQPVFVFMQCDPMHMNVMPPMFNQPLMFPPTIPPFQQFGNFPMANPWRPASHYPDQKFRERPVTPKNIPLEKIDFIDPPVDPRKHRHLDMEEIELILPNFFMEVKPMINREFKRSNPQFEENPNVKRPRLTDPRLQKRVAYSSNQTTTKISYEKYAINKLNQMSLFDPSASPYTSTCSSTSSSDESENENKQTLPNGTNNSNGNETCHNNSTQLIGSEENRKQYNTSQTKTNDSDSDSDATMDFSAEKLKKITKRKKKLMKESKKDRSDRNPSTDSKVPPISINMKKMKVIKKSNFKLVSESDTSSSESEIPEKSLAYAANIYASELNIEEAIKADLQANLLNDEPADSQTAKNDQSLAAQSEAPQPTPNADVSAQNELPGDDANIENSAEKSAETTEVATSVVTEPILNDETAVESELRRINCGETTENDFNSVAETAQLVEELILNDDPEKMITDMPAPEKVSTNTLLMDLTDSETINLDQLLLAIHSPAIEPISNIEDYLGEPMNTDNECGATDDNHSAAIANTVVDSPRKKENEKTTQGTGSAVRCETISNHIEVKPNKTLSEEHDITDAPMLKLSPIDVNINNNLFECITDNGMHSTDTNIAALETEASVSPTSLSVDLALRQSKNSLAKPNTDARITATTNECQLCTYQTKNDWKRLVEHYVNEHPTAEIYNSRLPRKFTAKNICAKPVSAVAAGGKKFKSNCYFCDKSYTFTEPQWITHFTQHTGEFEYRCNNCKQKVTSKSHNICGSADMNVRIAQFQCENNNLYAHICCLCNYTQLNRDNLLKHIEHTHQNVGESLSHECLEIILFKIAETPKSLPLSDAPLNLSKVKMELNTSDADKSAAAVPSNLNDSRMDTKQCPELIAAKTKYIRSGSELMLLPPIVISDESEDEEKPLSSKKAGKKVINCFIAETIDLVSE